jgi:hypothetical protein
VAKIMTKQFPPQHTAQQGCSHYKVSPHMLKTACYQGAIIPRQMWINNTVIDWRRNMLQKIVVQCKVDNDQKGAIMGIHFSWHYHGNVTTRM